MPAKKKAEVEKVVLLGRPSNTLKMGLVGLPNVGKSTTFNVLSNLSVPAENYPFCTIDPNLAKINIPDDRFKALVEKHHPKSVVPATFNITDIAGLVKGASEGKGLGNAFLSHISGVDGIYHVVRAFEDDEITHDEGDVNPVRDMDIIHSELAKKDLQHIEKRLDDLEKTIARTNKKEDKDEKELLLRVQELLNNNKWVKDGEWKPTEVETINSYTFLTAKPVVYLVNISEEEYKKKQNKWLPKIKEWINNHGGGPMIPFCAGYEARLVDLGATDEESRAKIAEEEGIPSMLTRIIKVGYKTLRLGHFFTAGEDEVRAWTIRLGWKAPQAAGVIHTDFERGFICAEVYKYADLAEREMDLSKVKADGLYRQQGKDYTVEDGDIIFFKFNVSGGKKKK